MPRIWKWATVMAVALAAALPGHALPIPSQHPVYDFIRTLELRGAVPSGAGGPAGVRPWDSREVAAALEAAAPGRLRDRERRDLERYLDEFSRERRLATTRLKASDTGYLLMAGAEFWGGGFVADSLPERPGYLTGSFAARVDAEFLEHAYLTSSVFIGMERSSVARFTETYHPADGLQYNTDRDGKAGIPQAVSTFDGFRAVAGYDRGIARLEVGQDWNGWGPGRWQRMTLGPNGYFWTQDSLPPSDTVGFPGTRFPGRHRRGYSRPGESAPMPQVRLRLRGGGFTYVKVVAERDGVIPDQLATLVAHRLEWRPFPFLVLGGSEMTSIGGRVPGPIFWLPLVPLKVLEHQVRDKDNLALSVDVEVRRAGWGRAYGELYLDDFSGPPFSFWGNKFAYTLGVEWIDPFRLPFSWSAEFAHVDPWVFTHHLPGRQHQHAGAFYGSALPANSRALWTEVAVPLPRDMEAYLHYQFQQRDLRTRGSSPFDVHVKGVDADRKDFLGREPETRHRMEAALAWTWRRHFRFRGGAGLLLVDAWKGEGESLAGPLLGGEIAVRY